MQSLHGFIKDFQSLDLSWVKQQEQLKMFRSALQVITFSEQLQTIFPVVSEQENNPSDYKSEWLFSEAASVHRNLLLIIWSS